MHQPTSLCERLNFRATKSVFEMQLSINNCVSHMFRPEFPNVSQVAPMG